MNNGHNNIILIGFMGSGKTTFGKWITRNHNMEFLDTDVYIVLHDGIFDYIGSIWRRLYTCIAV